MGAETLIDVVVLEDPPVGFEPNRIRLLWMLLASPTALLGTLIRVLRKFANFVISIDCALATKITSLLCICSLVARKKPAGSAKLTE